MDVTNLTIESILEGYKSKKFSVTEVVSLYLERIKQHDKELNSFITVCDKEALLDAKRKDEEIASGVELPLLGIPIALKDIFSTKGIRTTAASNVLKDYIPQYDATVVKKLKDAGAIILGKLNHDAWAHGSSGENSDFGSTKNPWNKEFTPGGSSSGSAVSVAAGFTPIATGTDTGGSIRQPASFTNTVGLKPTYGRVSRYGVISMASSLDSIGHFTKTVTDSALFLNITAGADGFDATLHKERSDDYTKSLKNGIKGMRLGIPKEFVSTGLQKEVKTKFEEAIKVFEKLGAEIVEVSLPNTEYGIATYYIIQTAEVSSNLARFDGIRFGNDRTHFGDEAKRRIMLGTYVLSAGYYDAYYKKAMQVRTLVKQDYEKVFDPSADEVDALIAPVSPTLPWKLEEKVNDPLAMYLSDALTVTANIAGIPGLSVPAGFSNGLPIGIQILGPQFSEEKLFQIGYAFEQETEYHKQIPKI